MKQHITKSLQLIFVIGFISLLTNCSASKRQQDYRVSDKKELGLSGSTESVNPHDKIPKGAIRIKGIVMSSGKKVDETLVYDFKILEVVSHGSSYTAAAPKPDEVIELVTSGVNFKKDSQVEVNVWAPSSKTTGKMSLILVEE